MRNKIDDQYAEFASEAEKEKLKAKLEAIEV
jgi:heat shock 70kDa protein 4